MEPWPLASGLRNFWIILICAMALKLRQCLRLRDPVDLSGKHFLGALARCHGRGLIEIFGARAVSASTVTRWG